MSNDAVLIRNDLHPGDIGTIIYLHGILYAREYDFDHTFEPYVAIPLAEFVKRQNERERVWIVEKEGRVLGSVAIVAFSESQAQLAQCKGDSSCGPTGTQDEGLWFVFAN